MLLLSIKGTVDAQVQNVRLNLKLGFNFTSYHAFVDKADVTNTGYVYSLTACQISVMLVVNLVLGPLP